MCVARVRGRYRVVWRPSAGGGGGAAAARPCTRCLMRALPRTQQMRIHAHDPGDPFWRISCSNPASQGGHRLDDAAMPPCGAPCALGLRSTHVIAPCGPVFLGGERDRPQAIEMPLMRPARYLRPRGRRRAYARRAARSAADDCSEEFFWIRDDRRKPGRSPRGSARSRDRAVSGPVPPPARRCADPSHRVRARRRAAGRLRLQALHRHRRHPVAQARARRS